jgi:hypothetical protein
VAATDHGPEMPNPPRVSIDALRQILSTIDPKTQPRAYEAMRNQLDDAIARKLKESPRRPPD